MTHFVSNFVAMAIRVCLCEISLTPLAWPRKPLVRQKDLGDIYYASQVIVVFFYQIWLPWQQGSVVVEFVWRRSIAEPQKPLISANISVIFPIQVKLWPRDHPKVNSNDAVKLPIPENHTLEYPLYLVYNRSYDSLKFFKIFPIVIFSIFSNKSVKY